MIESPQIDQQVQKVGEQSARWLRSRFASPVLALIAFAESMFAPILIDPFLVALVLAKPESWKRYTIVAITASVAGGAAAYFTAAFFFNEFVNGILAWEHFESQFNSISESLNQNAFWFTLIGAVTPIPYKLVALAAGFLQINFALFLLASIIGRIIRLGFVGYIAYRFGPYALKLFHARFNTFALIALIFLAIYLIYRLV